MKTLFFAFGYVVAALFCTLGAFLALVAMLAILALMLDVTADAVILVIPFAALLFGPIPALTLLHYLLRKIRYPLDAFRDARRARVGFEPIFDRKAPR